MRHRRKPQRYTLTAQGLSARICKASFKTGKPIRRVVRELMRH
ncbi:MAG: hypothetical protein WBP93_18395 [Pyrinomonadaceae bacterium]